MVSHTNRFIPSLFVLALLMSASSVVHAAPNVKDKQPAASEQSLSSNPIDINSATLADLQALPGVGVVTAQKIVEGRPYTSIDDLKTRNIVKGKTYEKIRNLVSVKPAKGTIRRDSSLSPGVNAN